MATPTTNSATKTSSYSSGQAPARIGAPVARQRKMSEYGRQLAEKQKARREYGLRERQFSNYFTKAAKSTLPTGQALFMALELRLDNVLYRSGIAKTRRMARQLVNHGLVRVNDAKVSNPSYSLKEGDTITLKKDDFIEYNKDIIIPDWLSYEAKKKTAKVARLPKADDLQTDINSQLIIEYYSR